jgi:hypothetical protein
MTRETIERLIRIAWPHVVEVSCIKHDFEISAGLGPCIEIDRDQTKWTAHAVQGWYHLALHFYCGSCDGLWQGNIVARSGHLYPPLNTTYDLPWLERTVPRDLERLSAMLKGMYGSDCKIMNYEARHGLPHRSESFALFGVEGIECYNGMHYSRVFTAPTIEYPISMVVQHRSPQLVANVGAGMSCPCGDPFCSGCATGYGKQQSANSGLGGPGYAVAPTQPPVINPGNGYLTHQNMNIPSPGSFTLNPVNTISGVNIMASTPALDAHDVLKKLDAGLTAKLGMISSSNFFLHRFTIHDSDNIDDKINAAITELNERLGDKIGILGDMKIVGLDEPVHCGGVTITTDKVSTATGKVAVHLARRESYRAWKVTVLALVKSE